MTFKLDTRLEEDTLPLHETEDFLTLLMNDQRFPWVIIVPKIPDISEVYQLTPDIQTALHSLSIRIGRNMMEYFKGDKLNTAVIGNIVQQLHVHHVVRFKTDSAWPGPVWGSGAPLRYTPAQATEKIGILQTFLAGDS